MLDYVNTLNQKRGVSRLTLACLAASCFLHFCLALTLYLFPQMLAGGYLHKFRGLRWGTAVTDEDMQEWRMVAILDRPERMNMPSPETLRSLGLGKRDEGEGSPPVVISFGLPEALETDKLPLPQIPPRIEEPEVVIPNDRGPGDQDAAKPDAESSGESRETEPAEPGTGKDALAAKPEAAPPVEIAADMVPLKIPDTISPPAPNQPPAVKPDAAKPDGANKTARGSGAELFDTQGFPMGEYKDIVVGLVNSKWLIPSQLRKTFGRTAVVFYIDVNGRVTDLRVETSSGNKSLDNAALSAVWTAVPFPPLPKGFPRERVGVRLFLTYVP